MVNYKALTDAKDASYLAKLGIALDEESEDAEEEANPAEVGRFEELTGSTTDVIDPPPTSIDFYRLLMYLDFYRLFCT